MKAHILQQQGLPAFQLFSHLLGLQPDAVGREANVFATAQNVIKQNAQALGYRLQAHLRIGFALRPAQVRSQNEPRSVPQRVFNGRQSFANASVIHDAAVVQRHVEVDAHEDALIVQRKIAN